jgi:hypothetical protein
MNRKQTVTLWVGVALLVLMCACPPWNWTFQPQGSGKVVKPAGYALLTNPPAPERDSPPFGVEVNLSRLFLQVIAISAVTGAAAVTLREESGT